MTIITMMAAFGELVSLCLQGNTRENLRTPGCLICFWEIHTYSAAQVKGHFCRCVCMTDRRILMKQVAGAYSLEFNFLPSWLETSLTLITWNLPVPNWIDKINRDWCFPFKEYNMNIRLDTSRKNNRHSYPLVCSCSAVPFKQNSRGRPIISSCSTHSELFSRL